MNEFAEWVTAQGFDAEALTLSQRTALQAAWRAQQNPAPTPANAGAANAAAANADFEAVINDARSENDRRRMVSGIVADALARNPSQVETLERVGRLAIEGRWTKEQTELAVLKIANGYGPNPWQPAQAHDSAEVLEAALCRAAGLGTAALEASFGDQTLSAVDRRYRGGIGLQELVETAARRNGCREPSIRRNHAATMRAAFREPDEYGPHAGMYASVGPSTISVSGILGNAGNKFVREAFLAVEPSWREVCAFRSVNDFKEITSYALTGDLTYEKVPAGGEIKHGTLGERSYGNKADTYAKLLGLDRRDMVNDDLNAFSSVMKRLGRGGALKVNDVVWTEFKDDAAFFPTDNSLANYVAHASSALSAAGLELANTAFMRQTDPNGKALGSRPAILLVPIELDGTARTLMSSESLNLVSSTSALTGNKNTWAGRFKPVSTVYLTAAKVWYLLADPNDLPVIEIALLNGRDMPVIETVEMSPDRLGMIVRGYHDFGARLQEYRGGVKVKGEA